MIYLMLSMFVSSKQTFFFNKYDTKSCDALIWSIQTRIDQSYHVSLDLIYVLTLYQRFQKNVDDVIILSLNTVIYYSIMAWQ